VTLSYVFLFFTSALTRDDINPTIDQTFCNFVCPRGSVNGIDLKELGVSCRNVWNFAQGLKFMADFHSKMSVFCRHELGGEGVQPPTLPPDSSNPAKRVCCNSPFNSGTGEENPHVQYYIVWKGSYDYSVIIMSTMLCWSQEVVMCNKQATRTDRATETLFSGYLADHYRFKQFGPRPF